MVKVSLARRCLAKAEMSIEARRFAEQRRCLERRGSAERRKGRGPQRTAEKRKEPQRNAKEWRRGAKDCKGVALRGYAATVNVD